MALIPIREESLFKFKVRILANTIPMLWDKRREPKDVLFEGSHYDWMNLENCHVILDTCYTSDDFYIMVHFKEKDDAIKFRLLWV